MFKYIFYPVLSVKIVVNIISIYLYISNISIFIIRNELLDFLGIRYVEISGGKYTPLLYGLYKDPNFTAMMGVSLILIAIYIYIKGRNLISNIEKILIAVSVVLEFIIVSFSNSRGTVYSLLAIITLAVAFIILNKYRKNDLLTYSSGKKY